MRRERFALSTVFAFLICATFAAGQAGRVPVIAPPGKVNAPPHQPGNDGGMVLQNPQARVSTAQQLQAALLAAANSETRCEIPYLIWVEDDANIQLDDVLSSAPNPPAAILQVPSCVTLASGRSATVNGGLLHLFHSVASQTYALSLGQGARVSGLRIEGPYGGADSQKVANGAILISGVDRAMVDNNEIFDWPHAGVDVLGVTTTKDTAQQIEVTGNFLHDNLMCGFGLGVSVGHQGYAYVDKNLFDYHRHAVADDGCDTGEAGCAGDTGYYAYLNFVLAGGATCPSGGPLGGLAPYYNQNFDVHGTGGNCGHVDHCGGVAGEYFDLRYNTIRGDQGYDIVKTRPAFELRGTPLIAAYFRDNAMKHDNQGDAISTPAHNPQPKLFLSNNEYNFDTSYELAVGDFDGDGFADVFQSTGQEWVYSPRGRREWRYLNQSSIRLSGLAFGDFNGDGETDVFMQEGSEWLVSYSGTGPWTKLLAGSNIPMSNYAFADIDGDGKTDVLESNGAEWFYSSGGATGWQHLNYSKISIKDVRFGHFNFKNPKETDIFAVVNGEWSVSFAGTGKWTKLNDKLSDSVDGLVFADFDGDGITDIAYGFGNLPPAGSGAGGGNTGTPPPPPKPITWYVSKSGRGPWVVLRTWTPAVGELDPPLSQWLVGDFDGDHRADAITQFVGPDGLPYFYWSSGAAAPAVKRSTYTTQ